MVLTKIPFQIDMIMDAKGEIMNVMVTVRFFELQNKMIATTDKTEIEIEAHVSKYILYYIYLYIIQFFFLNYKNITFS